MITDHPKPCDPEWERSMRNYLKRRWDRVEKLVPLVESLLKILAELRDAREVIGPAHDQNPPGQNTGI